MKIEITRSKKATSFWSLILQLNTEQHIVTSKFCILLCYAIPLPDGKSGKLFLVWKLCDRLFFFVLSKRYGNIVNSSDTKA